MGAVRSNRIRGPVRITGTKLPAVLGATAAAAALAVMPGCDLQENADVDNGRMLFVENCGRCHSLTQAGTTAMIGPNLDSAFKAARETGMDKDTVEGVVSAQIENPRVTDEDSPSYMPANLVTGTDADDVAAYVAQYAGVPGVKPPIPANSPPGAQVFLAQGCGSCHTLAALPDVAIGNVGPNLDEVLPGQTPKDVQNSIVDPNATIEKGFPSGVMPQNYGDVLSPKELQDLADYLVKVAGKGK